MGLFDNIMNGVRANVGRAVEDKIYGIANSEINKAMASVRHGVKTGAVGRLTTFVTAADAVSSGGGVLSPEPAVSAQSPQKNGNMDLVSFDDFLKTPNHLYGGISPEKARDVHITGVSSKRYAMKNLFFIAAKSGLSEDFAEFNLFATEVEYAPYTINGEKRRIGSAVTDSVNESAPVEMRVTTLDDADGTVKKWFEMHANAAAPSDGTVGLPSLFGIGITVWHSIVEKSEKAYKDVLYFRAANIEYSHSRREDGLQEIQMTFQQIDTFMKK